MFKQWTDMAAKWGESAEELRALGARLNGTREVVNRLRNTQAALVTMRQRIQEETGNLLQALERSFTAWLPS